MINNNILKHHEKHNHTEEEMYGAYKLFLGTLVSEPRLKIINMLRDKKKNVSQISKELKMDQTAVSHNLKRLKTCGFVTSEVDKKFRYYKLNEKTIKPLMELIDKHMAGHCIHILKNSQERIKKAKERKSN